MSIAKEDAPVIREAVSGLIEEVSRRIEGSPCETLFCLNTDWVEVGPA